MKKVLFLGLFFIRITSWSQEVEQQQFWAGIMTSFRVGEKSLIWNDAHLVPGAFFIIRTGYTHETKLGRFTLGLAHLWLPNGPETMQRDEWRPWGQWFLSKKIGESQWQYQFRVRYDARFREDIINGQIVSNEFSFNHRLRFQGTVRYNLLQLTEKDKLFVAGGGELLINKKQNQYWMDQNRRNVTLGIARKGISFQTGYMNRQNFNEVGDKLQINHTWINWLILEF